MRRLSIAIVVVALTIVSFAVPARSAEFTIRVLKHRLNNNALQLYLEVTDHVNKPLALKLMEKGFALDTGIGGAMSLSLSKFQGKGKGVATILMIDRSGSMKGLDDRVRDAAIKYIDAMRQEDQIALFFFGAGKEVTPFSKDPGKLRAWLNGHYEKATPPGRGETLLHAYLMEAILLAANAGSDFPLVVMLTDGVDTGGDTYTKQDVGKRAMDNQVPLFSLGFKLFRNDQAKRNNDVSNAKELRHLEGLAEATNGWATEVDDNTDVTREFLAIRERLDNVLIMDMELCGYARAEVASRPPNNIRVTYEDRGESIWYPVIMAPIPKDFEVPACPDCPKNEDQECKGDEKCEGGYCKALTCPDVWQKPQDHACRDIKCKDLEADKELDKCPEGTWCVEATGFCGKEPPKVGPCQVRGDDGVPVARPCVEDCSCDSGCLCVEGACKVSPRPEATERPTCATCEFPVDGKCLLLSCRDDDDCRAKCTDVEGSCVCRKVEHPIEGGEKKLCVREVFETPAACAMSCQTVSSMGACVDIACTGNDGCSEKCGCSDKGKCAVAPDPGQCPECQQAIHGTCGFPPCKEDADCGEGCGCDTAQGLCSALWFCAKTENRMTCYAVGGGLLLLILLLIIIFVATRKPKFEEEEELDPEEESVEDDAEEIVRQTEIGEEVVRPPTVLETGLTLAVYWNDQLQTQMPVTVDTITVGADNSNTLPLDIPTISFRHATFTYRSGQLMLRDDGSTNGTFLNDSRLAPGVDISIGVGQVVLLGSAVSIQVLGPHGDAGGQPIFKGTVIDR